MKSTSVQKSLQEMVIRLAAMYGLALILILGIAVFFNSILKHELASQASQLITRMVKRGDYRETIYTLSNANLTSFRGVVFETEEGGRLFSLPTSLDFGRINTNRFLTAMAVGEFTFPVMFGSGGKELGRVKFYFERFELCMAALGIWTIFVLLTLPLVQSYKRRILIDHEKQVALEKADSRSEVARKVRHNVRSPLTALQSTAYSATDIPESRKMLLRSIAGRIEGVLSELSVQSPGETTITPVLALVQEVVNESRAVVGSKNIVIEADSRDGLIGFAKLNPIPFRTHLSNLIQNAIDAVGSEGVITVYVDPKPSSISVKVTDNGCGINRSLLTRIGEKGFTHGKTSGSGLGVHYAKVYFEEIGGSLEIQSVWGSGTCVDVSFPSEMVPGYFANSVNISTPENIVALDDDETILSTWKELLSATPITLDTFSSPEQLQAWHYKSGPNNGCYFIDYEMRNSGMDGIDLAQVLELKNVFLLTSHYDELDVQTRCRRHNIKLIPKVLMPSLTLSHEFTAG